MNVRVNAEYMKHVSQEIYDMSRQIMKLVPECEDVERGLKRQTAFRPILPALREIQDDIMEEVYKLNVLSEALVNVGAQYNRAEERIEDELEIQKPERTWMRTGYIDLTRVKNRMEILLYGGENGWQ